MFYLVWLVFVPVFWAWELKIDPDVGERTVWNRQSGSSLAALCSVEGLPEDSKHPGIFWSKSPDSISKTGNVHLKKIDKFALSLVIPNASVEDSGIYTCTATYLGHRKTVSLEINFFAEIKLIHSETEVVEPVEGANVNLSCEVISNDRSLITMWEKDITALTAESERNFYFYKNDQVLEIKSYMPTDAGIYNCKVLDRRTGSIVTRKFRVGSQMEEQHQFCNNMCHAFCSSFYTVPKH